MCPLFPCVSHYDVIRTYIQVYKCFYYYYNFFFFVTGNLSRAKSFRLVPEYTDVCASYV